MRASAALALAVILAFTACRKKSSPEFFRLEGEYEVLVNAEGDDAYGSPELAAILTGLRAIPADVLEADRVRALVKTIEREEARVKAERVPVAAVGAPQGDPDRAYAAFAQQREATVREAAAEATQKAELEAKKPRAPYKGMTEADFDRHFGDCFAPAAKAELPGGKHGTGRKVKDSKDCQERFGIAGQDTTWLFDDQGLWGQTSSVSSSSTERTVLDAGAAPPAQPAAPPEPVGPSVFGLPAIESPPEPVEP